MKTVKTIFEIVYMGIIILCAASFLYGLVTGQINTNLFN